MEEIIRVLFLGDIVGPLGRAGVRKYLALHKVQDQIDFVIANGENATHGHGLSFDHYKELISYGIDCLTSGNHYFNSNDCFRHDKEMPNAIRPINLDQDAPGKGFCIFSVKDTKILVSNALGRTFINNAQSNPFYALDKVVQENPDYIHIVDFHAEATAEKRVMGEYLDGKVSAVLGTHTHVQTNDAKCLNKGTFFLTDVGMNGAYDSSLGDEKLNAMHRTITGMPASLSVPKVGRILINGVVMNINIHTKRVVNHYLINEIFENAD